MGKSIHCRAGEVQSSARRAGPIVTALVAGLSACSPSGGGDDGPPTSGASGDLEVSPTSTFSAGGPRGGPFGDTDDYTVVNAGDGDLFWSVAAGAPWLKLSALSGTLAPGASQQLTVSVDAGFAGGLASGTYQSTIEFRDLGSGDSPVTVTATLDVDVPPASGGLEVSPESFTTGGPKGGPFGAPNRTLTLLNPAGGPVSWRASSNVSWLAVSPNSGTLAAGAQVQVLATLQGGASSLGTGTHAGRLTFENTSGGAVLDQVDVTLGIGTTIENQAWLNVHGKRFIPIGVWNQPPWLIGYLKGLGINTYLNNGLGQTDPSNPQLMDDLAANDMWAIMQYDPAIKDHPRLLGWLLGDEPDLYNTPVASVQQAYDALKAADPDHFVALNTTGSFYWDSNFGSPSVESLYHGYFGIPDIGSFDMYPVTGWNQPSWVYMPGAMSRFLLERYVNRQKPVWAIVEASDQRLSWTPPSTTGPSAAQMRFQAWDSLINGATAIHYFTIAFDPFEWANLTPTVEAELTRTNGQIAALTDVILSVPPAMQVSSSESSGLPHDFMLRRKGDTYYLFADNEDMGYRSETITFTFPQAITSVTVYDEGRTITPSGSSFSDSFAPLEVHIYEIRF